MMATHMLGDLKVLDLSTGSGLMCGQLLADMGAEVQQWIRPADVRQLQADPHWQAYTIGKGVQVVDWTEDLARLRAELAHADVLIESHGHAALGQLGLARAEIESNYPALIHVSITGFGSAGPKAGIPYTDLTVTAASGHLFVTGDRAAAPLRISVPQALAHAAADAAVGVLVALADRDQSGLGQHVDAAGQDSLTLALLSRGLDAAVGNAKAQRSAFASAMGHVQVRNQFQARDGWVVVLQGVVPPLAAFMTRLMAWVHEGGLCAAEDLDWDWGSVGLRMARGEISAAQWAPVQAGIEALVSRHTRQSLMDEAVARRLLIAPVLTAAELLDSRHLAERGFVVSGRRGRRLGAFARFGSSPLPLRESEPRSLTLVEPSPSSLAKTRMPTAPARISGGGPLAGVKVLDLFWVVAGPGATRMLADHGATVIHVESSRRLDMVRNVPPYIGGVTEPERAACHHTTNCNKLNITLDLATDAGKAVLADLVRWADVFTESFAPGVIDRMGFGYDAVRAINPGLIMLSSSLMGQTGPWSPYAGYGNLAAAVSGFHALTGMPGAPPTGCFGPYTDFTSVRFNALALLGALRHRAATGRGQYIDMGQAEAALHYLAPACLDWLERGKVRTANGNRDLNDVPSGVFPVQGDDRWIAIAVSSDDQWLRLCKLAGFPDLLAEGVLDAAARRAHEERIEQRLAAWTGAQDGVRLEAALLAAGIPAHRVLDTCELAEDAQLAFRQHFLPARHPLHGQTAVESSRVHLSRSPGRHPDVVPVFGCDNATVLREILGYDDVRVHALLDGGVMQ